uniref:CRAL-TRIO domain-containing protein n=1 Tax=Heterorhabditis bacteriophora TaxID=37862 RepID=A0A1I7W6S1_HETBA
MTVWPTIPPNDAKKIQELRELVKEDLSDYYDTDFNLLQYIKLKLLRKSTWDLDNMRKKPRCHPIHNYWKYGITGLSGVHENVIVNIEQVIIKVIILNVLIIVFVYFVFVNCGRTDYSGMMECFSVSEVMRARILDLEEMLGMCLKKYKISMCKNFQAQIKSNCLFVYQKFFQFFVPVCLPSFAYALWIVVRPLLPERTKNKVRILSSSNWKEDILEFANREALPAIWNDEKHKFPVHIEVPIPYPKEMFYSNKNVKIPEGTKPIDVIAGKSHVITKHLSTGDIISWWISGNKAYGFGFLEAKNEDDNDFEVTTYFNMII